ncbi:MAG TPA: FtsX-like permease family protein [Phycisphaerales bacterium]|nr:FtsX-like permease family protein [Phycisphaerales bacterium]
MPAAWRLATSNLSARRGRTALLCACVALCAALVCAIGCAIASINAGLEQRITETIGAGTLKLTHPGRAEFDASVIGTIDRWPGVRLVSGRLIDSMVLRNPAADLDHRSIVYGVMPGREERLRRFDVESGRMLAADDEVVLDVRTAQVLNLTVGQKLEVVRFGEKDTLTVVGTVRPPPLSQYLGAQTPAYLTLAAVQRMGDHPGAVHEVEIVLEDAAAADAERFVASHRPEIPRPLILQPTARVTAGFEANRQTSQVGLLVASVFAFIAASFIIATGMTTGVSERTRELAVLRCIGGTRRQLAASQVISGLLVGATGAVVGVPLGVASAAFLVSRFPTQLPGGFAVSVPGVVSAALGAVGAGVIGALWSAWSAARVSPLQGLAARARPPRPDVILAMLVAAVALLCLHAAIVASRPTNTEGFFWLYVPIAIPAMLIGYFALGTPLTVAVSRLVSPMISTALRLPPRLLERTLAQTPFRHGFTAASMMVGLAMLVSIWTNGRSVLEFWLDKLVFPDAFVTGLSIKPDTADRIRRVEGVKDACAITMQTVSTDAFGISGLTRYKTTFMAFEPETFFSMTRVEWVQGDQETAVARLKQGGCVLVAKEFYVTRKIGLGHKLVLKDDNGAPFEFEVVGVVTSPGLDIASKFFDIGENYVEQAVNSVFGTRADLKRCFGNESISLVQINFEPGADPEKTYTAVRRLQGTGVIAGGTAVWLKKHVHEMIGGSLKIFSLVAIGALVIASFGVANIIIAGVQARTYQFGVLRAVGAQRWLLGRLVIAEALVIALAACVLGTGLGLQAAWGGQNVTSSAVGVEFGFRPPYAATAWAWLTVVVITVAAAAPTAWVLVRRSPRQLLGVMRG